MINPYSYFGEKFIWPRGFRLSDIGNNDNHFFLINSKQLLLKPLVYQGLINGIPDVDSIFFQTRIKKISKIDFHFSKIYPLIYFPGKYIPLNSKNTIYMYDIFPFIALPTTINQEISDILRGYIIQRFAWGYNGSILYHTSDVYRNKSNDFMSLTYKRENVLFAPCVITHSDNISIILN